MQAENSWRERLQTIPQYLLPQHLLTAGMYTLTRCTWAPLKNLLIRTVIRHYQVDMELAQQPDHRYYQCFNDFFTRELKAGVRPLAAGTDLIVSPVDGSISQIGAIEETAILQAKGHTYDLASLLAGEDQLVNSFRDGKFATLYLSPRDYHRIHMPISGQLIQMIYVPGRLFSVNRATSRCVPNLYARNERLINIFQTDIGLMAVILIGAFFVGSMATVWAGQITPASVRARRIWDYRDPGRMVKLERGEELGRFNMGSSVILLFEPGRIDWLEQLRTDDTVVMGQAMAKIASGK